MPHRLDDMASEFYRRWFAGWHLQVQHGVVDRQCMSGLKPPTYSCRQRQTCKCLRGRKSQPLVQQRGGGRVLEQGFFFGAQQGHGTKGG
jgi:hypothetical protein